MKYRPNQHVHANPSSNVGLYRAWTGRVWNKHPTVAPSVRTQACNVRAEHLYN